MRLQNVRVWCWKEIWNQIFVLIAVVAAFLLLFYRWYKLRKTSSRIKNGEVLKWESTKKEAKKSQPLHTASTPISGENIFYSTVPYTRRAHAIGEGPGNDRTANQKLVSKPQISTTTPQQRGRQKQNDVARDGGRVINYAEKAKSK